ncbi:SprT family protein [Desmospora profundinema]|uniref:SprT-like protein n=1 Tax=Desmospora profundinema TaxID=1571184 RepID=A0ABU1IS34_9BACL|nr:SprT family protein [Desmospora profundinema]MDR6227550.1 SprT-like protein [Desmospora profundinema]
MNPKLLFDDELQRRVETISRRDFGKPFRHRACFNPRLRTTGGRYFLSDHRIEINPRHWLECGAEVVDGIIRHELCHYHLHLEKRGYRHGDREFKELLAHVKGLRHAPVLPGSGKRSVRWLLVCQHCGHEYPRRKRMDPARYRCGKCRGRLRLREIAVCDHDDGPF